MFRLRFVLSRAVALTLPLGAALSPSSECEVDKKCFVNFESDQVLSNWSSTHTKNAKRMYEPRDIKELNRVLSYHQSSKSKIRPVGTLLSPNGIALPVKDGNALSMHHFDEITVDHGNMRVTVGAGASVRNVLNALSEYGLTLENFSSIQEQQIAGWTQVAAHGTGCGLPTVEEQIIEMKIATPAEGVLTLSESKLPSVFRMAKVGLGSVGVVTQLTLRCIPKLTLREKTMTLTRDTISADHYERLRRCRHVRYMWIPYTPTVVSVTSNPDCSRDHNSAINPTVSIPDGMNKTSGDSVPPTQPLIDLIVDKHKSEKPIPGKSFESAVESSRDFLSSQSFAQLRDIALGSDPLSLENVKRVNIAEAKYWQQAQGTRSGDSTDILGFDCGGEQWVLEMCFPIGSLQEETFADILFVQELLEMVETLGIPAPGPIEQRWTARSTSPMSPAYSEKPEDKFCWVGIIMYTPSSQTDSQREDIRQSFMKYCDILKPLMEKYNAQLHWAKIEPPDSATSEGEVLEKSTQAMRDRIRSKYPVDEFKELRRALDPSAVLSNDLVEILLDYI